MAGDAAYHTYLGLQRVACGEIWPVSEVWIPTHVNYISD